MYVTYYRYLRKAKGSKWLINVVYTLFQSLHPLLEDGCQGDEEAEPYKKVAFIGISNWALDPAKMNRGILVQRRVPDVKELVDSAR